MTRVGWIGLGAMGRPMVGVAAAAGFDVRAYDVNPRQLENLEQPGLAAASSPADAANGADVLVVMVATPAQGEAVLFGERGIAQLLQAGSVVTIMSTVGPEAVVGWAEALAANGVELVDAPVSGGVTRAGAGELLTMVGGADAVVEKVRELLDAVSGSVIRIGPNVGDGQRMKLVNQLLCGVHIAVAAEALGFAEALDLSAAAAWEVVRQGAAFSFMLDDRGPRMLEGSFEDVRSAINIFAKDMGLVSAAAHQAMYPTPIASAAEQMYLVARRAGFGTLDDSSVIEVARGTFTSSEKRK
jgi:3-hydroxyisobutyrate dehydrogenase/putative dehydrogenase